MRKKIVAANWKMNVAPAQVANYFKNFNPVEAGDNEIVFFPMAVSCSAVAEVLGQKPWQWGAQNFYFQESGAFTGEISGKLFKSLGASYLLVGHSERRSLFAESDEMIAKKVAAAQAWAATPLICVGESLEQRESGMTDEVITSQLKRALSLAQLDQPFVVAYEPVWAIGTGKVATAGQADAAHGALRKLLADLGGDRLADITSILYGGSVKLENAHELASCAEIDGFLIGGAALDPALFGLLCGARL